MVDTDKSFAETYGLNKPARLTIQKNSNTPMHSEKLPPPMVPGTPLIVSSVKLTAKNHKQLKLLEQLMTTTLKKSVGRSAVLRNLIHLAATDNGVREKLLVLIPLENIHGGRPRSKP